MILAKNVFGNKRLFMMMLMCSMAKVMHHQWLFMQNFFVVHNAIFLKARRLNFYWLAWLFSSATVFIESAVCAAIIAFAFIYSGLCLIIHSLNSFCVSTTITPRMVKCPLPHI